MRARKVEKEVIMTERKREELHPLHSTGQLFLMLYILLITYKCSKVYHLFS